MSSRRSNLMKASGLASAPVNRQTEREKAEAMALAEVERLSDVRRQKSERLRRLRLAQKSG